MKFGDNEFFNRNKKLLLIAFIIVFGSLVVGSIAGYFEAGDSYGQMSEMISFSHQNNITTNMGLTASDTSGLEYFIHNLIIDVMTILGGLLLSVPSVLNVLSSSFTAGSLIGKDFIFGAVATLPHGIIEYLATVFALTIAFIITRREILIIKNRRFDGIKTDLKDILVLLILDIIFLAVAGFIETYITPGIISSVFGI